MDKRTRALAAENEIEEKKIWDASEEIYTDIVVYLRVSRLPAYSQELVRRDVIHMILDGQERGQESGRSSVRIIRDSAMKLSTPFRRKDKKKSPEVNSI